MDLAINPSHVPDLSGIWACRRSEQSVSQVLSGRVWTTLNPIVKKLKSNIKASVQTSVGNLRDCKTRPGIVMA